MLLMPNVDIAIKGEVRGVVGNGSHSMQLLLQLFVMHGNSFCLWEMSCLPFAYVFTLHAFLHTGYPDNLIENSAESRMHVACSHCRILVL